LLDTKLLDRLAQGRKEESYWPVAVAQNKFHCIILKGGDTEPYFPRPLLSEFDFKLPVSTTPPKDRNADEEQLSTEVSRFEEAFVRETLMLSLLEDIVTSTNSTRDQRAEVVRKEMEVDKILLQMLAVECREGEERGMKALELVELMKDRSGKMLEAAVKVAQRYDRSVLEEKIREVGNRRLMGIDDDDELA
jgi:chromosome transmission fidelity protein 4